ncbi:hypothetical protein A7D00_3512 [Trichophyton violaceum]|uniref:Uncharacterized protein n=1 Tax=Trichophyton violaceum TaxID=34388 RepID=A0A178FIY5_TRIVO|nr:hypothetical protein A7D00_3512 [Trichophyton violaceum]
MVRNLLIATGENEEGAMDSRKVKLLLCNAFIPTFNTLYNVITTPRPPRPSTISCVFLRKYHERAYFALEPIEENPKSHTLPLIAAYSQPLPT